MVADCQDMMEALVGPLAQIALVGIRHSHVARSSHCYGYAWA